MFSIQFWIAVMLPLYAAAYFCPESHLCTCYKGVLGCLCEHRDNISLYGSIEEDIEHIFIEGCGTVHVMMGVLSFRNLKTLEFNDIEKLIVHKNAMYGLQVTSYFIIGNISDFVVLNNAFSGIQNMSTLIINNVTAEITESGFSKIENVNLFKVSRSYLGKLSNFSFHFGKVNTFILEECDIEEMLSMSFLIDEVKSLTINTTKIETTHSASFVIRSSRHVEFTNCAFEVLSNAVFRIDRVEKFLFRSSYIVDLQPRAFQHIGVTKEMTFEDNAMERAQKYSMPPSDWLYEAIKSKKVVFHSNRNVFTCDCSLYWWWQMDDDRYQDIMLQGSCMNSPAMNLSEVTPIRDQDDNCLGMNLNYTTILRQVVVESGGNPRVNIETTKMSILMTLFLFITLFFGAII